MPAKKKTEGHKVKVGGVIANGKGGYYEEGDVIDEVADVDSLKAKGFI